MIKEINIITGEITERELTPQEIAQMEQMNAELEALQNQVPDKISSRQLRSQLILQGFNLETIEQALNQLPEPNRSLAKVDWEYATNFYRNNAMIVAVGQLLQLTEEQIDNIFIQGALL